MGGGGGGGTCNFSADTDTTINGKDKELFGLMNLLSKIVGCLDKAGQWPEGVKMVVGYWEGRQ